MSGGPSSTVCVEIQETGPQLRLLAPGTQGIPPRYLLMSSKPPSLSRFCLFLITATGQVARVLAGPQSFSSLVASPPYRQRLGQN